MLATPALHQAAIVRRATSRAGEPAWDCLNQVRLAYARCAVRPERRAGLHLRSRCDPSSPRRVTWAQRAPTMTSA